MAPAVSGLRVRGATVAGGSANQDRHVVLPHAVLVLDGASADEPSGRDGGWYADRLGAALAGALTAAPEADLAETLEQAIATLVREHGLRPGTAPSSTVALVRWIDGVLDALVLGDAKVIAVLPAPNLLDDLTPWGGASTREIELCDLRIADVAPGVAPAPPASAAPGRDLRRRARRAARGHPRGGARGPQHRGRLLDRRGGSAGRPPGAHRTVAPDRPRRRRPGDRRRLARLLAVPDAPRTRPTSSCGPSGSTRRPRWT